MLFRHLRAAGDVGVLRAGVELLFCEVFEAARLGLTLARFTSEVSVCEIPDGLAIISGLADRRGNALPQLRDAGDRCQRGEQGEFAQLAAASRPLGAGVCMLKIVARSLGINSSASDLNTGIIDGEVWMKAI